MSDRKQLFSFILLLSTSSLVLGEATPCPGNSAPLHYHSLERSQIATSVTINHAGPYEFMVDTGAQISVMEPSLAAELGLQPQGSIGVVAVGTYAKAGLVKAEIVEAGAVIVRQLLIAIEGLEQIQALNPHVRGILGENFLGRFDLLIDHRRKMVCFDESKQMQQAVQGERIPVLARAEPTGDLAFTQAVLISVHLSGEGRKGTVLRVDSGSNTPILFSSRDSLPWLQRSSARRATVAGSGTLSFVTTPIQTMRIGQHIVRSIAFQTPIATGHALSKVGEDGLLPTSLFKRVFISYADRFVIFEPVERHQN